MNEIFKHYCNKYEYVIIPYMNSVASWCKKHGFVWKRLQKDVESYIIIWNCRRNLQTGKELPPDNDAFHRLVTTCEVLWDSEKNKPDLTQFRNGTEGPLHHVVVSNELPS